MLRHFETLTDPYEDHPGQQVLEGALDYSMYKTDFQKALNSLRSHAQAEITKSLASYNVDVIISPAVARMASVAAAADYPLGVVPWTRRLQRSCVLHEFNSPCW